MANMNNMASILQNLDDTQLQQQMQSPNGQVPQFLLLSEMQRRKKMRDEAGTPSGPPPTTTVADDIMMQNQERPNQYGQPQQQGVAGLPQMGGSMPAPGGIAAFAGGGEVEEEENHFAFGPRTKLPSGPGQMPKAMTDYFSRVKSQVKDSLAMPDKATVDDYMEKQGFAGVGRALGAARDWATKPRDSGTMFGNNSKVPPGVYSGMDGASSDLPRGEPVRIETSGTNGDKGNRPTIENPFSPEAIERAGIGGGMRGKSGIGQGIASIGAPAPKTGRNGLEVPAMPGPLDDPQMKQAQDYLEMVRQQNPDMLGPMIEAANQRVEGNQKGRKDAANMALMQAGLGMMASKNGRFLGAAGEGGMSGLKAYGDQMQQVSSRDMELQKQRDNLKLAQAEAARGNFKTAAELARDANTQALTKHGHDRAERRDDLNMIHQTRMMNFQGEKADRQLDLEERKLRSEDMYRRGMISNGAARAAGGGKAGSAESKEAKAAVSVYEKLRKEYIANRKNDYNYAANPAQLEAEAHREALKGVNEAMHPYIMRLYGGVASVAPQQKVDMTLTKDGFIK